MHHRLGAALRDRLRDRARAHSFFSFMGRRFLDDRLFESAGALSFTTVFALVPLSMVVFGILSAFPVFKDWSNQLSDYIFSNFVPSSARAVEAYLKGFSENTKQLTAAGVIALVVSVLITLNSVEATFNRIWRVKTARPKFSRFLVYWTVLTLGALVAATSLALSARFFALPVFATAPGQALDLVAVQPTPIATAFGEAAEHAQQSVDLVTLGQAHRRRLVAERRHGRGRRGTENDRHPAQEDPHQEDRDEGERAVDLLVGTELAEVESDAPLHQLEQQH
jgi:hypothetical protein